MGGKNLDEVEEKFGKSIFLFLLFGSRFMIVSDFAKLVPATFIDPSSSSGSFYLAFLSPLQMPYVIPQTSTQLHV